MSIRDHTVSEPARDIRWQAAKFREPTRDDIDRALLIQMLEGVARSLRRGTMDVAEAEHIIALFQKRVSDEH